MNKISLAHSYVQNQQQSSWIDDPFEVGTQDFKGVKYIMTHSRALSEFTEELVVRFSKCSYDQYELSLEMLPEEEQNELARLYIESIDREIEYACYGEDESINSDYLCALLAMLKDNCPSTRESFAEITRRNILIYYASTLQTLLDDACVEYEQNLGNEQSSSLYLHKYSDEDDVYGGRY